MLFSKDFSRRLKEVIEESGLKRDEFADKTGKSRNQLFKYLGGKQEPSMSFFLNIKDEFPWVDLNWLIADSSQPVRRGDQTVNGDGSVAVGGRISITGSDSRIGGIHGVESSGAEDPEVTEVCNLIRQYASKSFLTKIKEKLLLIKGMTDI